MRLIVNDAAAGLNGKIDGEDGWLMWYASSSVQGRYMKMTGGDGS